MSSASATEVVDRTLRAVPPKNLVAGSAAILAVIMVGSLADAAGPLVLPLCTIGGIALLGALDHPFRVEKTKPLQLAGN